MVAVSHNSYEGSGPGCRGEQEPEGKAPGDAEGLAASPAITRGARVWLVFNCAARALAFSRILPWCPVPQLALNSGHCWSVACGAVPRPETNRTNGTIGDLAGALTVQLVL